MDSAIVLVVVSSFPRTSVDVSMTPEHGNPRVLSFVLTGAVVPTFDELIAASGRGKNSLLFVIIFGSLDV